MTMALITSAAASVALPAGRHSSARGVRPSHAPFHMSLSSTAFTRDVSGVRVRSGQRGAQQMRASTRGARIICAMGRGDSVAITGGTGLIGSRLAVKLASQGVSVKILTRNPSSAQKFVGTPNVSCHGPSDWASAIKGCKAVVNLAGEPIANRWDDRVKGEIVRSRVDTTQKLVNAINALDKSERPSVFLSSSAIGFYGSSETASFDEASPAGRDFLADVCVKWEDAARKADVDRVVIVRTGIVLAKEGGALAKMLPVFQLFAGGPLGSGQQWFSWIHREDLVALMVEALNNPAYNGVYNGTAPQPVRMGEMCDALGRILGRPSWLPVPEFALQTLLGEGAIVVLEGQKVLPNNALQAGFSFKYTDINSALRSIV